MKTLFPEIRSQMEALLDLPQIRHRLSPISVEEYHHTGEFNVNFRRTELVRGIVIEKPRKSPRYSYISVEISHLAAQMVIEGFRVRTGSPLTFRDSEPEPDLAIVRGSGDNYRDAHPSTAMLAVEIVDGNPALERILASIYAEAGVDNYWIVLAHERAVEVYRSPANGAYRERLTVSGNSILSCSSVPGFSISLDDLFGTQEA